MNSKLITYWINSEDTPIGNGGAFRHYKYNLEKISIPKDENKLIVALVNKVLKKMDVRAINKIDFVVYSIYNLTQEEIEFIENRED